MSAAISHRDNYWYPVEILTYRTTSNTVSPKTWLVAFSPNGIVHTESNCTLEQFSDGDCRGVLA